MKEEFYKGSKVPRRVGKHSPGPNQPVKHVTCLSGELRRPHSTTTLGRSEDTSGSMWGRPVVGGFLHGNKKRKTMRKIKSFEVMYNFISVIVLLGGTWVDPRKKIKDGSTI